jgi:hypothetical protein
VSVTSSTSFMTVAPRALTFLVAAALAAGGMWLAAGQVGSTL